MLLSLIVAMDQNRLIGAGNRLPWRLPGDMAHFKATTMGKPIIMGRKTWESLKGALPGRHNIVISRQPGYLAEGANVVASLDDAIRLASGEDEAVVIGGAQIYAEALPRVGRLYLTLIRHAFDGGDAWFPAYKAGDWREVARRDVEPDEKNAHAFSVITLERLRDR